MRLLISFQHMKPGAGGRLSRTFLEARRYQAVCNALLRKAGMSQPPSMAAGLLFICHC